MRALVLAAVAAVLVLPAAALAAPPYAVGDTLPAARFDDQHGRTHILHEQVRVVVFSRDMEAGDVIKAAFRDDGGALLGATGAVYIADVSGMPSMIRRMFALPKMRQRPYPMLLDVDGDDTARFPTRDGQATVLVLEKLRITNVQHHPDAIGLRDALSALAVPGAAAPAGAPTGAEAAR